MSSVLATYRRLAPRTAPAARTRIARRAELVASVAEAVAGGEGVVPAIARVAERCRIPAGSLKRWYYAWKKSGDDALIDARHNSRGSSAAKWLPVFKTYAERDLNTTRNAWRKMISDLRDGKVFPGLGSWSDLWAAEHPFSPLPDRCDPAWIPSGASYPSLMRALRADPDGVFALAASRRGMRAAHAHVLPVLTTRRGLPVGAIYEFDDVWHNIDIMLPTGKVAQPLEFAGYDVASGYKCMSVVKPRFVAEDGTRSNLKEQQFRFAFAAHMVSVGFHKAGVRCVVEHGTTAIRPPVERKIRLIPGFGSLISFARSGILSEQVHAGLFIGSGGGNFRFKALVESSHGVMHNRTASLPGNRGRDAEHMHESRDALVKYEEKTFAELEKWGGPGFGARMQSGLLSFDEYVSAFRRAEAEVMDDPIHRLEGWDERTVAEYRLGPGAPWRNAEELMDMDPAGANAIAAFLAVHPDCRRRRFMTRREVWARGQAELIRFPLFEMPAFLDESDTREVVVRQDGTFGFRDALYFGRDEVLYRAEARSFEGAVRRFAPGTRLTVFWNPILPDQVWVVDRDSGITIGTAPLHVRAPTYDQDAIKRAMGAQSHDLARKVLPIRGRHQREAEERAARMSVNAELLREARAAAADLPDPPPEAEDGNPADALPEDESAALAAAYCDAGAPAGADDGFPH
ncbi:MAG: hypothetical protein IJS32_02530 [Kiritimatiellae bacterium]|nr:hypothetical protein [Kiritimatiellia bacterium]